MTPDFLGFAIVGSGAVVALAGVLALLCRGMRWQGVCYALLAIGSLVGAVASGMVLVQDLSLSLTVVGVPFVVTHFSALFTTLIYGATALVALFAPRYLKHHAREYHMPSLTLLTSVFVLGMLGVVMASSVLAFLVAWEVMSFASFLLVLADRSTASVRSGLWYLTMTHLGVGALILGFAIITGGHFMVGMMDLPTVAATLSPESALIAGLLLFFGFGSKAGLVPAHVWLPEAHPQAPSHISALLSGVMLKVALFGALVVFGALAPLLPVWFWYMVVGLGLVSAGYGALLAVVALDFKRLLAWSSIENMGLIFAVVGLAYIVPADAGRVLLNIALFMAVTHAVFKTGLFLSTGVLMNAAHTRSLEQLGGLARVMPKFSGAVLLLILAAAAMPPFGAFFGEWMVISSVCDFLSTASFSLQVVLTFMLMIFAFVAGMALFAFVKFFGIAMLGEARSEGAAAAKDPSACELTALYIFAFGGVVLGVGAPWVLAAMPLDATPLVTPVLLQVGVGIAPAWLALLLLVMLLVACVLRRMLSDARHERMYHTWDCGQPIDASMEYTATAFMAPIRFFFHLFTFVHKQVQKTPRVATNPWITDARFSMTNRLLFHEYLYEPLIRMLLFVSAQVRRIQSGIAQWYVALIFIALLASLYIAL